MIKVFSYFILLFCVVTFFSGCKSIAPLPPIEKIIDPPISTPKTSYLTIPIDLNLDKTFKEVENSIPKNFNGKESVCEGISYSYNLIRDPVLFETSSNRLSFSSKLKYSLNLSYCPKCTNFFSDKGNCVVPRFFGSCGINEPMRNAEISFYSKINLLPNYKMQSETILKKLELIDPCEITIVNYDITSILDKEIRNEMNSIQKEIDAEIEKIDVKSVCSKAWKELQNPIKIDSYGYLLINPDKISLSSLEFNNNHVSFILGIQAKPILKTEKVNPKILSLPEFVPISQKEGFQVTCDIYASYDSLNKWVINSFKENRLKIKGREIILDTIKMIGADGKRLFSEIYFSGTRKGKLYVSVEPILDEKNQKIILSDLQFDLRTKDLLIKTAKWLLNDKLKNKIEKDISFDLKEFLYTAQKEISNSLNTQLNDEVYLTGSVNSISIKELYPLKKGVFIRSEISGKMKLNIN